MLDVESNVCNRDIACLLDEKGGNAKVRDMVDCPSRAYLAVYMVVGLAQMPELVTIVHSSLWVIYQ
jgi:hypothetical protein